MRLSEIAKIVDGKLSGEDVEILHVAKIEEAGVGDITFVANLKYKTYLKTTTASAVLVSNETEFDELSDRTTPISVLKVPDPYRSFLQLVNTFHPPVKPLPQGIHPTAIIASSAMIGDNTSIGVYVVIGERCKVGARTTIYHGCILSDDVEIGEESLLYANVSVREQCRIGSRVIIHSGSVIGSDGFGFAPKPDGSYEKIHQCGIVVVEDDVEIGANCTIDRAILGETIIKKGVKLDNLIHIAHNVVIGEHTVIAAQTGISGSSKIGKYCALGGQVGLTGHITIADRTKIGAQSGVPKSIKESGKTYFGYPAREIQETLRIEGALRQLPELLYEVRKLQKKIEEIERLINQQKI
ncbi:MAG: UDP-3-O-(3-hydroxymyristoyl)glucosamine N-acyltransferase [Bacteroidota bacterium]|nr:UDP-3-O-(3-hydroxymyristoyl)glucosamine N-acyltransferase [Bacteroidota bacterium]